MRGIFYFLYFHPTAGPSGPTSGTTGHLTEGVMWDVLDAPLEGAEQFRSYSFWLGREG